MPIQLSAEIEQQVKHRVATGRYASEEAVLREALAALADQEDDFEAVQEAVDAWRGGDEGIPLEEAFAQIRTKYQPVTGS